MKSLRRSRTIPLHVRFARGYQIGFIIAILAAATVWVTTQSGMDEVEARTNSARDAAELVEDVRQSANLLDEISDSPMSLSVRSDLTRKINETAASWRSVSTANDMPDAVMVQVSGRRGLEGEFDIFLNQAAALAAIGNEGRDALSTTDSVTAATLESKADDLADRVGLVLAVYNAETDAASAGIRATTTTATLVSLAMVAALIAILLRPLRRLMERDSRALSAAHQQHRDESDRRDLASHLADGLEAAESEDETHRVVERVFLRLLPNTAVELLLADSAKGAVSRAVTHPTAGGPGCDVDSPWSCPAVRRGRTMVYEDSESINACPHLSNRPGGACSATCVPLSFMGDSMGVVHTAGPVGQVMEPAAVDLLGSIASQVAVRIGTIRSFKQVELRASTDPLTGLPNRRATEEQLRRLVNDTETGAVVMADLDRFKQLNDKYGHEAGDRALRLFADSVRQALRDQDWIGRWGGEEFVLALPAMTAPMAKEALDRVREHLADACLRAEAPTVTVSMGVVDSTAAVACDELIRLADEALLAAKTQGRDRVVVGPVVVTEMVGFSEETTDKSAETA